MTQRKTTIYSLMVEDRLRQTIPLAKLKRWVECMWDLFDDETVIVTLVNNEGLQIELDEYEH